MAKLRIKMLVGIAGVQKGADFSIAAGEETDRFPRKEALALIESGQAAPVSDIKPETAVKSAPEKRAGLVKRAAKALGLD